MSWCTENLIIFLLITFIIGFYIDNKHLREDNEFKDEVIDKLRKGYWS